MSQIPAFTDYSMENRTYKFFKGKPLYPFGYGLSYGNIEYYDVKLSADKISVGENISVSVKCANRGKMGVKETVQAYLRDDNASTRVPIHKLVGFKKIDLAAGGEKTVSFTIKAQNMAIITEFGKKIIEPGHLLCLSEAPSRI